MEWKKLDRNCFEAENDNFYFHLRKEGKSWILDIFENRKPYEYLETFSFDISDEAKLDAEKYIPYVK